MAFELGFLVGSLALLGLVVYITRIRGPSLPHETMVEGSAEHEEERERTGEQTVRADPLNPHPTTDAATESCELCGENPASQSVNDMAVCAECNEDLL